MIDLRRFVDINIKGQQLFQANGSRPTTVLITRFADAECPTGTFKSVAEFNAAKSELSILTSNVDKYVETYFLNGGVELKILTNVSAIALGATIRSLSDEEILVCCHGYHANLLAEKAYINTMMSTAAGYNRNEYGIKSKLFFACTDSFSIEDSNKLPNVVYKYVKTESDSVYDFSSVMTMCAYLSKINVAKSNSIFDYCYTAELPETIVQDITDDNFGDLQTENINVDIYLAGAVRNVGGNCADGSDLVNNFIRIILQQTLTYRLIRLLATKLKDSSGISSIYSAIVSEMQRYVNCGYLSLDKIWTKDDLTIDYNGQNYTIITKGTALVNGYTVTILPLSSLSDDDKAIRNAPPIYLVLAEQYGIRVITINGEVI